METFQHRKNPNLIEINSPIFLKRLSRKYKRPLTLATIPERVWIDLSKQGFDMIWLMGVWKRSHAAREPALTDPVLRKEFIDALPDLKDEDISGSPYAVKEYSLDHSLGNNGDLFILKENMNRAGLKLILDFVPNHLSLDHPWTISHPERFINGTKADLRNFPDAFFKVKNKELYLAHGKDPYFPSWTDTVQVNYFSAEAREAMIKEIMNIAKVCEGVRCDMAMLILNQVFQETWSRFLNGEKQPDKEFWEEAIKKVKKKHPEFIFVAESYWDLEWVLQNLGFDYTYDKKLYDLLLNGNASDLKGHLNAELPYQEKSARFIENHDEKRSAWIFGKHKVQAAAALITTIPGLHMFFDGQVIGKKVRLPVQLIREPVENEDQAMLEFYRRLLAFSNCDPMNIGKWELRESKTSWQSNETFGNLIAYSWEINFQIRLVVVNYSSIRSQGRIIIPERFLKSSQLIFIDHLNDKKYIREGKELRELGLFIDLEPWKAHLFEIL